MRNLNFNNKAIGLFLLRVLIGWHLLYEGLTKLVNPDWSSVGFLKASQGPFSWGFLTIAENETMLGIADVLNEWSLTIIGLFLILGLFIRTSAYAGMFLLLTYYLCVPPLVGLEYATASEGNYLVVNKTLIEASALFVLALFASENYLGLDLLISRKSAN